MNHGMRNGNRPLAALLRIAVAIAGAMSFAGCATFGFGAPQDESGEPRDLGVEVRPNAPPEYDLLVGLQHESHGALAEATAAYQRALAKDEDSSFIHRRLANSLIRQGVPSQALEHAKLAFELDPEDEKTRLFLGQLYRLAR